MDEEKMMKDKDFVKFYRKFIKDISDLSLSNPTALKVLLFLIRNMDGFNALGIPMDVMVDMLGLSRQTISRQLKYLKENGWIEIMKLGQSNVYVVNPDIAWTSYGDQKTYCKFQGSIMLSGEDNWDVRNKDKGFYKFIDTRVTTQIDTDFQAGAEEK